LVLSPSNAQIAHRFSITAQDETYPYRYVTAEGSSTSIENADDATMRAIAVRYLGEERSLVRGGVGLAPSSKPASLALAAFFLVPPRSTDDAKRVAEDLRGRSTCWPHLFRVADYSRPRFATATY
jgi:hypothetical protein